MAERVEITGPTGERYVEILSPKALELLVALHDALADRRAELLAARRRRQAELSAGAMLDFLPETAHIREDTLAGRAARARPGRPAGRDHRPDRPQDDDQRAQLRGQGLAGRLRGRQHSAVGEHDRGPAQPQGRPRPDDRLHLRGGEELRARPRRHPGHHRGQAARLAPGREAHPDRRAAGVRQPDRLRPLHGRVRAAPAGQGQGPVLLPAEDWSPTSRRGCGTTRSTSPRTSSPSRAARSGPRC